MELDLCSLESVKRFVDNFKSKRLYESHLKYIFFVVKKKQNKKFFIQAVEHAFFECCHI